MALIQGVSVVVQVRKACLFVLGFLNVLYLAIWIAQLNITVEPRLLQLDDLVLGLAHHMREAVAGVHICCAVRQNAVFCWHEHRHLASQIGIVVDLLKCRTGSWQAPEHSFVFWAVLRHDFGQLEVHIFFYPRCGFFYLGGFFTDDLGTHRTLRGECF